ncbi:MAG TPA: hypothetical protein VGQ20_05940, partial [Acidimicrobiales bacterium]|nr:hypothetical protein [Acidimicrobiales bacterium]
MVIGLFVLLVLLLVAGAAAAGIVLGARRSGGSSAPISAGPDLGATVAMSVSAALAERDATVQHAVDTVIRVAGTELEARLKAGAERVDLRAESFERRAQDISTELSRMRDLMAGLQQERSQQHGEVLSRLEQTATAAASLQQTAQGL